MDTAALIATLKKAAAYLGAGVGIITAITLGLQGDYGGAFTAFAAALAAVGVNVPVHQQLKAAK